MEPNALQIRSFTGGMAQTNGYLIGSSKNDSHCLLVDAPLGISAWLEELGEKPTDLLLTHQHYDHVEDAAKIAARGARIHAYAAYSEDLTLEKLLQQSGIPIKVEPYAVANLLEGETELDAGGLQFGLEHVPGHSPDSVVFIHDQVAFGGDTLFAGGIGRADLPEGNMELLVSGIRGKLFSLDSKTTIYPGHGPDTTIGVEKATNPFL
ncbi:MAG: MBL fold metallo-hydrolase [Verrucomicrobiae bacterium]|nr:MBL fold metallo-hydrolase [Verrucomicrobiae bacterium]NNJ87286.1 MBL fold metallo-hydrolase [Akkermansiaceae bacterium]